MKKQHLFAKMNQNFDNKQINVKSVFYDGKTIQTFADQNFKLDELDIAYEHFEKWCFTFMCDNYKPYVDERTPSKVAKFASKLLRGEKDIIYVIFKDNTNYAQPQKMCCVCLQTIDKE